VHWYRVLIDGNDASVGHELEGRGGGVAQVSAEDERRLDQRPDRDVRAVLGVRHAAIAYLEHIPARAEDDHGTFAQQHQYQYVLLRA
jgi:hypothetical protein